MATACMVANPLRVRVRVPASTRRGPGRHRGCARTSAKGAGSGEPVVRALEPVEDERAAVMTEDGVATRVGEAGVGRTRADAGAEASTSDSGSAPRWALGAFAASAVALGVAEADATEQGKPLADHLTHLLIHGYLHLLGHDHETATEAETMEGLEIKALASLGIDNPYLTD